MKVSTRGDYASRALLSLALHGDAQSPTSVRDIAERTGLPQPYLEQILLALKGAGLVRSKRGVGGGYVLARPPEEITLGQIVSAVDGPIVAGDFGRPHENGACEHEGQCILLTVWSEVGEHMREHLDSFTLARHGAAGPRGIPRPGRVRCTDRIRHACRRHRRHASERHPRCRSTGARPPSSRSQPEHADGGRAEGEHRPVGGGRSATHRAATTRRTWAWAKASDVAGPSPDQPRPPGRPGPPPRAAVSPPGTPSRHSDHPGSFGPDLVGGPALVAPRSPIPRRSSHTSAAGPKPASSQVSRARRKRAREDQGEVVAGQPPAQLPGLRRPSGRAGEVGAPGVAARPAPLGGPVADDHQPGAGAGPGAGAPSGRRHRRGPSAPADHG